MSAERDDTRIVRSWLEEMAPRCSRTASWMPGLDQLPATPQRRNVPVGSDFPRARRARLRLRAGGGRRRVLSRNQISIGAGCGAQSRANAIANARASASPISLPVLRGRSPWDVPTAQILAITFMVPAGWSSCSDSLVEQTVVRRRAAPNRNQGLLRHREQYRGRSVRPRRGATRPARWTISRRSRRGHFEPLRLRGECPACAPRRSMATTASDSHRRLPRDPGCELEVLATKDRTNRVSPGEVNLLQVLDINGTRLVIAGHHPEEPAAAELRAALEQIMASVHISQSVMRRALRGWRAGLLHD